MCLYSWVLTGCCFNWNINRAKWGENLIGIERWRERASANRWVMTEETQRIHCIHTVSVTLSVCVCVYVRMCVLPEEQLMDLLLHCSHRLVPAVMAALNWNNVRSHTKRATHNCRHASCVCVCVVRVGTSRLPAGGHLRRRGGMDELKGRRNATEGNATQQAGSAVFMCVNRAFIRPFITR